MIVEQIRYYVSEDGRERFLELRREVTRLRHAAGAPAGRLLVADDGSDGGPVAVWQCGYEDEAEMGTAEATLIGNPEYEQARTELNDLIERVELEIYLTDDHDQAGGTSST